MSIRNLLSLICTLSATCGILSAAESNRIPKPLPKPMPLDGGYWVTPKAQAPAQWQPPVPQAPAAPAPRQGGGPWAKPAY